MLPKLSNGCQSVWPARGATVNLMPSLYVACVCLTKSLSLILRNRSRSTRGGMVASPTPTLPISGDSMTVMAHPVPGKARANMLAAIQPAVPPPTMAMLFIWESSDIWIRTFDREHSMAGMDASLHAGGWKAAPSHRKDATVPEPLTAYP